MAPAPAGGLSTLLMLAAPTRLRPRDRCAEPLPKSKAPLGLIQPGPCLPACLPACLDGCSNLPASCLLSTPSLLSSLFHSFFPSCSSLPFHHRTVRRLCYRPNFASWARPDPAALSRPLVSVRTLRGARAPVISSFWPPAPRLCYHYAIPSTPPSTSSSLYCRRSVFSSPPPGALPTSPPPAYTRLATTQLRPVIGLVDLRRHSWPPAPRWPTSPSSP